MSVTVTRALLLKRLMQLAPAVLLAFAVVAVVTAAAQTPAPPPAYVGSKACIACHTDAGEAWAHSHHALAWTDATPENVVADFDGTRFEHDGTVSVFNADDGVYAVTVTEKDGTTSRYPIHSVAGIAPLQQYLIETEPGRLQSFDVVWDNVRNRWYHLYPDQDLPPNDGLHWTGPYKNWNARCAACHATGFEKAYDGRSRTYASTEAEIGVGCEACHGPGEAHVAWANDTATPTTSTLGLSVDFGDNDVAIQQCAGCHSRREAFDDGNPPPGTPFHDAYNLALLRPGLYHADGQILDEVYVYGSFLQSKMYARGVGCMDCHNAHTAELKASTNAVCTQCHNPAGNPRFPTLALANYDDPSHHFHPQGEGAQCVACHMIERDYMGIDGRRDHSFRVPRPDLSVRIGTPNACTDCHTSESAQWAADALEERFPDSGHRGPHYGDVLAAGRSNASDAAADLLALAGNAQMPGIVRATALSLLAGANPLPRTGDVAALLADDDPLVRAAAVGALQGVPLEQSFADLAPMLRDQTRSVRIAAARALLSAPPSRVPPEVAADLRRAMGEWQSTLRIRLDFPETHIQLAGMALTMRNIPAAVAAFREVVRSDPQHVDAWVMLVRIAGATEGSVAASRVLQEALEENPDSDVLHSFSSAPR